MEAAEIAARADWHRQRYAMIHESLLYLHLIGIHREYRDELVSALADEVSDNDRLTPLFLASMLTAGHDITIQDDWLTGRRDFDPSALLEVIDYISDLFSGRLKPRRPARKPNEPPAPQKVRAR